jgi:hypothetical protein
MNEPSIYLCNIRTTDGTNYVGRECTIDDTGMHFDGPLYSLREGAFERLLASKAIDQMYPGQEWYIGKVPITEVHE